MQADQEKNSSVLSSGKPADVEKFVTRANSELATLARLAPGSIKSDVNTLVSGISKLYAVLKANGYDLQKASKSSALQNLDTPAFKSASSRVGAYVKQVCKITS